MKNRRVKGRCKGLGSVGERPLTPGFPKQHELVMSAELVPRKVFCVHYGKCLDFAIWSGWPGFSCVGCGCYVVERGFEKWLRSEVWQMFESIS